MKSPKARLSDAVKLIEETGLQVVEHTIAGSSHAKFVVRREDGKQMLFFASLSPSDYRAFSNNRALLRRFARGSLCT